jgi:2-polyprenyl-3-methyl-5-hydroxy-6-metoxy-1,4-benzoquinol methylase
MIEVKSCPVCGANSFKDVFKAPYFRGDGEMFSIKECGRCSLWVTSPRPDDNDLGKYYDTGEYISHNDKKEGLVDYLYHGVRAISLKRKVRLITKMNKGKKGKLLDYGAGTGHFAAAAQASGWEVVGVEPSREARKVAKKSNDLDLVDPDEMHGVEGKFNVISLWHVLEHLPDLNSHLKIFSNRLEVNGCLIIAVPNHESYDSKVYGANWAALDVPLHLYHFKRKNIEELATSHGLVLEEVFNMPFDSYYVSLLSEKVAHGKSNFIRAFFNGLKSNVKGKSDKNQSSLIYVLRKPHIKA